MAEYRFSARKAGTSDARCQSMAAARLLSPGEVMNRQVHGGATGEVTTARDTLSKKR